MIVLRKRVYVTAIGLGLIGYGVVGAMIPHTDPNMWHYLSAPAFGILVLIAGFMSERSRGLAN